MKVLALLLSLILAAPIAAAERAVPASIPDENILNLDLTTGGRVVILLRPDVAPNHVERIRTLADSGFYDGIIFHRVIPGFMAQTGDPEGTGQGGSELPDLEPEFNALPHLRGTVSMARASEPNSANSQFFITFMPRTQLDGEYTPFGRVFSGMEYVDAIAPGEPPAQPDRILQARTGRDVAPPTRDLAAADRQGATATSTAGQQNDLGRLLQELPGDVAPVGAEPDEDPEAAMEAESLVDPSN